MDVSQGYDKMQQLSFIAVVVVAVAALKSMFSSTQKKIY